MKNLDLNLWFKKFKEILQIYFNLESTINFIISIISFNYLINLLFSLI